MKGWKMEKTEKGKNEDNKWEIEKWGLTHNKHGK